MKHELRFTVRGSAKTLERSRQSRTGFRFDSAANRENKAFIRLKAETAAINEGVILPIPSGGKGYSVLLFVRVKPPKSYSKKRLKRIEGGLENPTPHKDLDNTLKLYLDALNDGIIEDDHYITSLAIQRRYAENDEVECVIFWEEEDDVE